MSIDYKPPKTMSQLERENVELRELVKDLFDFVADSDEVWDWLHSDEYGDDDENELLVRMHGLGIEVI